MKNYFMEGYSFAYQHTKIRTGQMQPGTAPTSQLSRLRQGNYMFKGCLIF